MVVQDGQAAAPGNFAGYYAQDHANSNLTWCVGYLNPLVPATPDNTNIALLMLSQLGPYAKAHDIYKCPGDKNKLVRSYAMNCYLGEVPGVAPYTRGFTHFYKANALAGMSTSNAFVFLDERTDSINDGCFFVDMYSGDAEMMDGPGFYHSKKGAVFSFADGHAEAKFWRDARMMPKTFTGYIPYCEDLVWLRERSTVPQ